VKGMSMPINKENIAVQMIVPRDLLVSSKSTNQYQNALIKNFSSHPLLNSFLTKNLGSLDIQWVGLKQRESVAIHEHTVDTLMIAVQGKCRLTGEMESIFNEGDTIIVPKHVKHGLTQDNDELFWGLAFRFHS
jgi:quercetin dioxygenase-like cupin family protein